ncbi:MAG TPA: hypothetical protein PK562_03610, partial [Candidatus Omnitrophota bacterium]|nr:hypothetical protein [Candidatus Omnitrophota bacterium]
RDNVNALVALKDAMLENVWGKAVDFEAAFGTMRRNPDFLDLIRRLPTHDFRKSLDFIKDMYMFLSSKDIDPNEALSEGVPAAARAVSNLEEFRSSIQGIEGQQIVKGIIVKFNEWKTKQYRQENIFLQEQELLRLSKEMELESRGPAGAWTQVYYAAILEKDEGPLKEAVKKLFAEQAMPDWKGRSPSAQDAFLRALARDFRLNGHAWYKLNKALDPNKDIPAYSKEQEADGGEKEDANIRFIAEALSLDEAYVQQHYAEFAAMEPRALRTDAVLDAMERLSDELEDILYAQWPRCCIAEALSGINPNEKDIIRAQRKASPVLTTGPPLPLAHRVVCCALLPLIDKALDKTVCVMKEFSPVAIASASEVAAISDAQLKTIIERFDSLDNLTREITREELLAMGPAVVKPLIVTKEAIAEKIAASKLVHPDAVLRRKDGGDENEQQPAADDARQDQENWLARKLKERKIQDKVRRVESMARSFGHDMKIQPGPGPMWGVDLEAKPPVMHCPESDLLDKKEEFVLGACLHEGAHRDITFPDPYVKQKPTRQFVWNALEDPRVNNWTKKKFEGADKYIDALYEDPKLLGADSNEPFNDQQVLPHLQYGFGAIHDWAYGKPHPRIKNKNVLEALEKTRKDYTGIFNTLAGTIDVERTDKDKLTITTADGRRQTVMYPEGDEAVDAPDLGLSVRRDGEKDLVIKDNRRHERKISAPDINEKTKVLMDLNPTATEKLKASKNVMRVLRDKIMPVYEPLVQESENLVKDQVRKRNQQGCKQCNRSGSGSGDQQGQQGQQDNKDQKGQHGGGGGGQEPQNKDQKGGSSDQNDEEDWDHELSEEEIVQRARQIVDEKSKEMADKFGAKVYTHAEKNAEEKAQKENEIEAAEESLRQEQEEREKEEAKAAQEAGEKPKKDETDRKSNKDSDKRLDQKKAARDAQFKGRSLGDLIDLKRKFEIQRKKHSTDYDKYYAPVSVIINTLIGYLDNILHKDTKPRFKGFYRTGKKIDLRRLMQADIAYEVKGISDDKVWLRKTRPESRSHRFSLLLDESGSIPAMGRVEDEIHGLVLLMETLQYLNIEFNVIGFHSGAWVHKEFDEKLDLAKKEELISEIINFMGGGATCDVDALRLAVEKMREETVDSRVIIIITDGEGNGHFNNTAVMQEEIEKAEAEGIKVIGLGIGEGITYVQQVYSHWVVEGDIENVPLAIASIIRD